MGNGYGITLIHGVCHGDLNQVIRERIVRI